MPDLCTCPDPRDTTFRNPACPVHNRPFITLPIAGPFKIAGSFKIDGKTIMLPRDATIEFITIGGAEPEDDAPTS